VSTVEYWCEYAWLGGEQPSTDVLVQVADGRIVAVQEGVPCPPRAVRLAGLTLPGLANAHSHAFHRALRGRTQVGAGSFWTWRDQMYDVAANLDPDQYLRLARATYAEMAMAGITCVGEFHYLHHQAGGVPYDEPNQMGAALVAAAADAGVRLTLLDTCYLHGGIGVAPNEVQQRFSDGTAGDWAERVDALHSVASDTVRVGAAVHSVRAVDPEAIGAVSSWAASAGAPLHAHVSEQRAENERCIEAYGLTPTALLADRGALGPTFTAVHATHLSGVDIGLLGSSGSGVCMCPTTERDLADGIGPAGSLRAAGSPIVLGSDSHAVIDLFEEARAVELDERLATTLRGHHRAVELLQGATVDGHRSLGWPDAGRIEVGRLADLVSVRLDSVRTAGLDLASALAGVVFAASAADVHHVVSNGKVVVSEGQHVALDVPRELAASIASVVTG